MSGSLQDLKRHIGNSETATDVVTADGDKATLWATDYEGDLAVFAEAGLVG